MGSCWILTLVDKLTSREMNELVCVILQLAVSSSCRVTFQPKFVFSLMFFYMRLEKVRFFLFAVFSSFILFELGLRIALAPIAARFSFEIRGGLKSAKA